MSSHDNETPGATHAHIAPISTLMGTFIALLVLTVVTVVVRSIDLGSMNIMIAMMIATIKAGLVAAYFMHLAYDGGFIRVAFFASIIFMGLFLGFALLDTSEYQDTIQWHETLKAKVPTEGSAADHGK